MKQFIALCVAIICLPVNAAIPLEQALELCRAEQNALRRLSCYDAIAINGVIAAPSEKNAQSPAAVSTKPEDTFGLEHKQSADTAEQLQLTVKSVRYTPHKELIVEFDNGQIWRQIGNDYYSIAAGQQHYIKRGVLNAFFLANHNNNRTIRIRREQ